MEPPSKINCLGVEVCNLKGVIIVQNSHFHSKLSTPKRLVLLGGSTYTCSFTDVCQYFACQVSQEGRILSENTLSWGRVVGGYLTLKIVKFKKYQGIQAVFVMKIKKYQGIFYRSWVVGVPALKIPFIIHHFLIIR